MAWNPCRAAPRRARAHSPDALFRIARNRPPPQGHGDDPKSSAASGVLLLGEQRTGAPGCPRSVGRGAEGCSAAMDWVARRGSDAWGRICRTPMPGAGWGMAFGGLPVRQRAAVPLGPGASSRAAPHGPRRASARRDGRSRCGPRDVGRVRPAPRRR